MSSKYAPVPNSPREDDFDKSSQGAVKTRFPHITTFVALVLSLIIYTLTLVAVTRDIIQSSDVDIPASSFPHPAEMEYLIQQTGQSGTPLHALAFDQPSPESDDGWYALLEPFNTRVPASKFNAMNRTSIQVADGSGDYYVTLTMYHEIHCLMRFRWFLYPEYYENKTWEEQAQDHHIMGHFKHCIWSLLESVLCHGDTSIRGFHWEDNKSAPVADSLVPERECVNRDWLYNQTKEYSFLLEDKILSHPIFGQLDEELAPVQLPVGYTPSKQDD